MKLTRTPSKYRKHDYSLVLTKDEVLALSQLDLLDKFMNLIDAEAMKIIDKEVERVESREQQQ